MSHQRKGKIKWLLPNSKMYIIGVYDHILFRKYEEGKGSSYDNVNLRPILSLWVSMYWTRGANMTSRESDLYQFTEIGFVQAQHWIIVVFKFPIRISGHLKLLMWFIKKSDNTIQVGKLEPSISIQLK